MSDLWVDKYRPKNINDYVFRDKKLKKQTEEWIKNKNIPHLILHGPAGTGKTSFVKMIINELKIKDNDLLFINASRDRGIDILRDNITKFAQIRLFDSPTKLVVLDEGDGCTPELQNSLKSAIEEYQSHVRFIITANHYNKIIDPIKSRCQSIEVTNMDKMDFYEKLINILENNNIKYKDNDLTRYVESSYPDLREAINKLELNCLSGELISYSEDDVKQWRIDSVELFKKDKYKEAREMICKNIKIDEYEDFYKFLYKNLQLFCKNESQNQEAIVIIRDGLVKHTIIADAEINLSATLIQLSSL